MKHVVFGLLILILATASLAGDGPSSPKAIQEIKDHDEIVRRANSDYWSKCLIADKRLADGLTGALSAAMRNSDDAECVVIRQMIADIEKRMDHETTAEQRGLAAAPLEPYSFQLDNPAAIAARDLKAPEITRSALMANGNALVGTRVKMTGEYLGAGNDEIGKIPGIVAPTVAADYSAVEVDPRHIYTGKTEIQNTAPLGLQNPSDWSGFVINDPDQIQMDTLFVPAKSLGGDIAALRRGQKISVYGTVIRLNLDGEFGIVCDKITQTLR